MSTVDPHPDSICNSPPDWDLHPTELLCPLCGYNLRHLTVGRCPECGFTFQWAELIEAEKTRHKYLFEHGTENNVKSFWKTFWTSCRPRKFWRDLNPAQPVFLGRLILYWLLATSLLALGIADSHIAQTLNRAKRNIDVRNAYASWPTAPVANVRAMFPLPWELPFWSQTISGPANPYSGYYNYSFSGNRRQTSIGVIWAISLMLWPWLTLITLLIFRMSMRHAKIHTIHILRTVLYACDFALLLTGALVVLMLNDPRVTDGWLMLSGAVICALITVYRLSIAFRKYLRVHLPVATVLATQLIVVLLVFVALSQFAEFQAVWK